MHKVLKPIILSLGAVLVLGASPMPPSPEGYWLTEKKSGIIEVFPCPDGDALCGRIAWFRIKPDDPNPQGLDLKNPDPALRTHSLCGLVFMKGFKADEPNDWEDGSVYDPDSGKTWHATMKLRDDGTLRLHGYIGVSLIGASEIWTRFIDTVPKCPGR